MLLDSQILLVSSLLGTGFLALVEVHVAFLWPLWPCLPGARPMWSTRSRRFPSGVCWWIHHATRRLPRFAACSVLKSWWISEFYLASYLPNTSLELKQDQKSCVSLIGIWKWNEICHYMPVLIWKTNLCAEEKRRMSWWRSRDIPTFVPAWAATMHIVLVHLSLSTSWCSVSEFHRAAFGKCGCSFGKQVWKHTFLHTVWYYVILYNYIRVH